MGGENIYRGCGLRHLLEGKKGFVGGKCKVMDSLPPPKGQAQEWFGLEVL
jgi:hypothetical protein